MLVQKSKILDWKVKKTPSILMNVKGKIGYVSIDNLLYRKFATVC